MNKRYSLCVFIYFLVASANAMYLPSREERLKYCKQKREKQEEENEKIRTIFQSGMYHEEQKPLDEIICEATPSWQSGATNAYALTTPQRYGSDLSVQEFDKLAYGYKGIFLLPSPIAPQSKTYYIAGAGEYGINSDNVLCTARQTLDPQGKKRYEQYYNIYQLINLLFPRKDKGVSERNECYLQLQTICTCDNKLREYKENLFFYKLFIDHGIKQIDHCIDGVNEQIGALRSWSSDKDLKAVLAKLHDDKHMLLNDGINEQNLIRALQLAPSLYPLLHGHSISLINIGHDSERTKCLTNMYLASSKGMPVVHSAIFGSNAKEAERYPYGTYFNIVNSGDLEILFTSDNQVQDSEDSEKCVVYLERDPRYNAAIHGQNDIVWFKFPHEADFDAGLGGQGTSWMYKEDAKKHVDTILQERNSTCLVQ